MDFTNSILIGLLVAFVFLAIQYGHTAQKKEGFKKILDDGRDLFASAPGFIMPESLMKDLPEAIDALRTNLINDETVHKMAVGFVGIFPAVLVATNKRVFRIYKGKKMTSVFFYTDLYSAKYCEISDILQQEKTFFSCIKIKPKNGDDIVVDKILDKKELDSFVQFVKSILEPQADISKEYTNINNDITLRIGRNGEDLGDMPIKKVKMLLASGHLAMTDLYWDHQLNEWIPLSCSALVE
jgi:hypothetical protein